MKSQSRFLFVLFIVLTGMIVLTACANDTGTTAQTGNASADQDNEKHPPLTNSDKSDNTQAASGSLTTFAAEPIMPGNVNQVEQLAFIDTSGIGFNDLAWTPDGTMLAFAGGDNLRFLLSDQLDTSLFITPGGFGATLYKIAISANGSTLAAVYCYQGEHHLDLYNLTAGIPLYGMPPAQSLNTGDDQIVEIAISPDATTIATGTTNGVVHIWNTSSGEEIANLASFDGAVNMVTYNSDGTLVAAYGGNDSAVRVYDLAASAERAPLQGQENILIRNFAFSPAGTYAAFSQWATVTLVNTATGDVLHTLSAPDSDQRLNALVFSADGTTLFTITQGDTLVWNVETGELAARPNEGLQSEGRILISSPIGNLAINESLQIFDSTTGTLLTTLETLPRDDLQSVDAITQIAFSPNGSLVAVSDQHALWLFGIHVSG